MQLLADWDILAIAIGPSGVALIPLINNGHWMGYVFGLLLMLVALLQPISLNSKGCC